MNLPSSELRLIFLSGDESSKFRVAFKKNRRLTKSITKEVKEWVANNVDRWKMEKPDWFNIELIPDDFLPQAVLEAEGGAANRRRSSVSLREIVGLEEKKDTTKVHPQG